MFVVLLIITECYSREKKEDKKDNMKIGTGSEEKKTDQCDRSL